MAIKIELIDITNNLLTAAFYYPVPAQRRLPAANDQSRTPQGSRLSSQELQELKDGELFEFVVTQDISGMTRPQVRQMLENVYARKKRDAAAQYKSLYGVVGIAWDGTSWN